MRCTDTIEMVYQGEAMLLEPRNKKLHRQVLVKNQKEGITFALELQKTRDICGSQFFQSQLTNVFVSLSADNFLHNVESNQNVDRLDNLVKILSLS